MRSSIQTALIFVAATLTLSACALIGQGGAVAQTDAITVVINSPADNTEVAVGQEVKVQITINDPNEVVNQQELRVDGIVVATSAAVAPTGAPAFSIIMPYTPTLPGNFTISAVALGSDGSSSQSEGISITVTGEVNGETDGETDGTDTNGTDTTGSDIAEEDKEDVMGGNVEPIPAESGCTNGMKYVTDVTIPDNTVLDQGVAFTKTWEIQNTGTCDWGGYQLVFAGDHQLGGPSSITVPATSAGQNVQVSVNLTSPVAPGTYKSTWTMREPTNGGLFGHRIFALVVVEDPAAANKADLILVNVATTQLDVLVGTTTTYNVVVKNQGNVESGNFTVQGDFEGIGTAGFGTTPLEVGATRIIPLDAFASTSGSLQVTFTVDVDDTVDESDEGNNVLTLTFPVVSIHSGGVFDVRGTFHGNLDSGSEDSGAGADFMWRQQSATTRSLVPENGATFSVTSASLTSYSDCLSATLSGDPIDGSDPDYSDLSVGTWVCARTSDGRISAFKIQAIDSGDNHRLTIAYTTYN